MSGPVPEALGLLAQAEHRQREAWGAGRAEPVEALLATFPGLAEQPEQVLDLLYHEVLFRSARGDTPGLAEYLARFPALGEQLAELFAVHDLFDEPSAASCIPPLPADTLVTGSPGLPVGQFAPPGYEVLRTIGRGGMGVVYCARQTGLNRLVALKALRGTGDEEKARFRREAESIARVSHPNIVQVFETGEHGGCPFLAMELVEGGSLDLKLRGGPLPAREAAALLQTLARAVHHAHEAGIIHRDLKPANVLMGDSGPKIADFGLAKRIDGLGPTASQTVLGTPGYMAPEQAIGRSKEVGPAADIYGLGAVLYECLTGKPPFQAETALDTALLVLTQEPVPPCRLNPRVPAELETVCLKCLEKEPQRRYATAEALADDLGRWLDGKPILARPAGLLLQSWKWARRHPAIAALVGTSLLSGLLLLVLGVVFNARLALRLGEIEQLKAEAGGLKEEAAIAAYRARFSAGWQAYSRADIKAAEGYLAACPADQRRLEWGLLRHLCRADLATLPVDQEAVQCLAFHPAGGTLAVGGGADWKRDAPGYLLMHTRPGGRLQRKPGHPEPVTTIAFGPDGVMASASLTLSSFVTKEKPRGKVVLWDAKGNKTEELAGSTAVAFSADGAHLAWVGEDGTIRVRERRSGQTTSLPKDESQVLCLGFCGPGLLASVGARVWVEEGRVRQRGVVRAWQLATGKQAWMRESDEAWMALASSPSSRLLAVAGSGRRIALLDQADGKLVRELVGHTDRVGSLAFAPGGDLLASAGPDRIIRLWEASTGTPRGELCGHATTVTALAFAPGRAADDWLLASGEHAGLVKYWGPAGTGYSGLRGHRAMVLHVVFSHDSQHVATASGDGTARLWTSAGTLVRRMDCPAQHVSFSPDGKWLATAEADMKDESKPGRVRLWPVGKSGEPKELIVTPGERAVAAVFSGDSRRVAVALGRLSIKGVKGGRVVLLDAEDGSMAGTCDADLGMPSSIAYSPDGKTLAVAGWNGQLGLFAASGGKPLRLVSLGETPLTALAYGPAGLVAVADERGRVALVEAETGERVHSFPAADGAVYGLSFDPTGSRLATASLPLNSVADVRLFDVGSGEEMLVLPGCHTVAFSKDGTRLAAPVAANPLLPPEVRLWHIPRWGK
jgi:WD40 repeat protein